MLTPEQEEELKKQLINVIEKNYPEDKKKFAIEKILSMNAQELEEFLIKNNLIKKTGDLDCVFCAITQNIISSKKIDENKNAVAVLEINPVSKGHVLIIPKDHINSSKKIPKDVFSLEKSVSKRIKSKLKPKKVLKKASNAFGHEVINLIPVYKDEKNLERYKASDEELVVLQELLLKETKISKVDKIKLDNKKISANTKNAEGMKLAWLPKRIP